MSAKMSTTSYCYALIYAGASEREWVRPIHECSRVPTKGKI